VHIGPVIAHVELPDPVVVPVASCQGADGLYTVLSVRAQGTITSSDPRLSGTFIGDALILDNPNTGIGMCADGEDPRPSHPQHARGPLAS
jgi:hypothetical protein